MPKNQQRMTATAVSPEAHVVNIKYNYVKQN